MRNWIKDEFFSLVVILSMSALSGVLVLFYLSWGVKDYPKQISLFEVIGEVRSEIEANPSYIPNAGVRRWTKANFGIELRLSRATVQGQRAMVLNVTPPSYREEPLEWMPRQWQVGLIETTQEATGVRKVQVVTIKRLENQEIQ